MNEIALIKELDQNRVNAKKQLALAEESFQKGVQDFFSVSASSLLAPHLGKIMGNALDVNVDPRWFFNRIAKCAQDIAGYSPVCWGAEFPAARNHEQFYNCAIHAVRYHQVRHPGDILTPGDKVVTESFERAATGVLQDSEIENKEGLSAVYSWLKINRGILYDINREFRRINWKDRDLINEIPALEDFKPGGLFPYIGREVYVRGRNNRDRGYAELMDYEGGLKGKHREELKSKLYDFGYKVRSKIRYSSEFGEPSYHQGEVALDGYEMRFFSEAIEHIDHLKASFEQKLDEGLTDEQKEQIDLYRRHLNPVRTPLTLGNIGLEYPSFIDSQIVYRKGVEFGFNFAEAAKLVDIGIKAALEGEDMDVFLTDMDRARGMLFSWLDLEEEEKESHLLAYLGEAPVQVKNARELVVGSSLFSEVLLRPARIKQLYEQEAYRIYRLPYAHEEK